MKFLQGTNRNSSGDNFPVGDRDPSGTATGPGAGENSHPRVSEDGAGCSNLTTGDPAGPQGPNYTLKISPFQQ